jgi:hypothetical protein
VKGVGRLKDYDGLFEYIAYFEESDASIRYCFEGEGRTSEGTYSFSHPVYDQRFLEFIEAVYESGLIDIAYFTILNRYLTRSFHNMEEVIEEADFELLRAVLAYYVRQERFGEGMWAAALRDRIFLKVLRRLRTILKDTAGGNTNGFQTCT